MSKKHRQSFRERNEKPYVSPQKKELTQADTEPDWSGTCEVCGRSPIMPITGMCGPCTTGDSDTAGGNW